MKQLILFIACLISLNANGQAYVNGIEYKQGESKESFQKRKHAADSAIYEEARQAYWKTHTNTTGEDEWIKRYTDQKESENAEKASYAQTVKELTPKYGASVAKRIAKGQVWIGMTDQMCELSLGRADDVKNTYTDKGKIERWYYSNAISSISGSLAFKNHKLIAISE